jgi:hypothetical protein|tara:strand:- start:6485 stop:6862 length:378 start_codon:yes stop_codon:yes gene_type:complete
MEIKQPENDKQIAFFDMLIETGSVSTAAKDVGYAHSYAYQLAKKYKDYILDRVEGMLYAHAIKAGTTVVDTMDADGKKPEGKLRLEAAKDVLDRIGLGKQDRIRLEVESVKGVFILPAKDLKPDE